MGDLLKFPLKESRMKFDVTKTLNSLDDKPLVGPDNKNITVRYVIVENLMAFDHKSEEHRHMTGEEKLWRFQLARQINTSEVVELKAEDVAKIKKIVGENAPPIIVGPLFEFLENSGLKIKKGA